MPIYEYICIKCGKRNSILVFPWEDEALKCKKCGSTELERIISRFRSLTSEESRLERLADSALRDVDYTNPDSVKSWMRKMAKEFSSELGSDIDADELAESISEEMKEKREESEEELD